MWGFFGSIRRARPKEYEYTFKQLALDRDEAVKSMTIKKPLIEEGL